MKSRLLRVCMVYACIVLLLGYLWGGLQPLRADDAVVGDGTPGSCTEAAFNAALTTVHNGGGTITFNCGGPATVVFTAVKVITANIIINGADQITLSGGDSTPLFTNQAALTLQNITLTDGFVNGFGGAIANAGNLTMTQVAILNSTANLGGGGISSHSQSTVVLTDVTLSGNSSSGANGGGGIWMNGDTAVLTNVTLSGNSAPHGGGILNEGRTITLTNVTLSDNSAVGGGGGIENHGGGTITLTNVTLSGNSAGTFGGGIDNWFGTAVLTNVTLSGNSALYGGGIDNSGTITLTSVTLSGNSASFSGGGIENGGTAELTNVTVSGNSVETSGGGIRNFGSITLTNATLSGNSADVGGGGIWNEDIPDSHLILKNSIVADSSSGGNCFGKAADEALFSLWDDDSCTFTAGSGNQPSTDPLLGPLADNGGQTLTHMLLPGSPAIDGGDSAGCPPTDQRGASRPQGAFCDLGAVEVEVQAVDVLITGTGSGSVTSDPTGINCGIICTAFFYPNSVITLTAVADTNSTFTGWSGACTGMGICVVTMDVAQTVTATFTQNEQTGFFIYLPVVARP